MSKFMSQVFTVGSCWSFKPYLNRSNRLIFQATPGAGHYLSRFNSFLVQMWFCDKPLAMKFARFHFPPVLLCYAFATLVALAAPELRITCDFIFSPLDWAKMLLFTLA